MGDKGERSMQCVLGDEKRLAELEAGVTGSLDRVLYGRRNNGQHDPMSWIDAGAHNGEPALKIRGVLRIDEIVRAALREEVRCLKCERNDGDRAAIDQMIEDGVVEIIEAVRLAILAVNQINLSSKEGASKAALANADNVAAAARKGIVKVVHGLLVGVRKAASACETGHKLAASEKLNLRDSLTGLLNRDGLLEYFGDLQDVLRASKSPRKGDEDLLHHGCAFLFIDLDRFKKVNDDYGHDAGDVILQDVASRIADSCRSNDGVCRFGGDEFVVVLRGVNYEMAIRRAEAIRGILEEYGTRQSHPELGIVPRITASVGVAHLSSQVAAYADFAHVSKFADIKMYDAKGKSGEEGRNRVVGGEYSSNVVLLQRSGEAA